MSILTPETEEMDVRFDLVSVVDLRSAFAQSEAFDGDDDEGEDEDSEDEGAEDENEDDADGSDTDDDAEDEDEAPTPEQVKAERKRLQEEAKKHRLAARKQRQRAEKAEADLAKAKGTKPKPKAAEEEEPDSSLAEAAAAENVALKIRLAIRDGLAKHKLDPAKIAGIERVIDAEDIDIEGNDVVGIDEALEQIREDYPEWIVKRKAKSDANDGDDEADDDDEEDTDKRKPAGRSVAGSKKGKDKLNRSSLESKYPALRGR